MMKRQNWLIAAGAMVALSVAAMGAQAQISAKGGPIDVTGDHFQASDAERVATYQGKVEVLQSGNRLRTDLLNIFFRKGAGAAPKTTGAAGAGGWGDIDHLEAVGNVYFVTPTQIVRGDKAVYTQASDTIVVTGNVVVTQGENVMHGERLVIQVGAGKTTMDSNGRVRGVFYPDKSKQGGAH